MEFYDFPYIGNVMIPADFHIFQRGRSTINQKLLQPPCFWVYFFKSFTPPFVFSHERVGDHHAQAIQQSLDQGLWSTGLSQGAEIQLWFGLVLGKHRRIRRIVELPHLCQMSLSLYVLYIIIVPIGSMYGIYANIWGILMVNVSICSIHGSYGVYTIHVMCIYRVYIIYIYIFIHNPSFAMYSIYTVQLPSR